MYIEFREAKVVLHTTEKTIREFYEKMLEFKKENPKEEFMHFTSQYSIINFQVRLESDPKRERMFPVYLPDWLLKMFPDCPKEIPWKLIDPHEPQVRDNHFHSLEEVAKTGGLTPIELWCVIKDQRIVPGIKMEDAVMWLKGFLGVLP